MRWYGVTMQALCALGSGLVVAAGSAAAQTAPAASSTAKDVRVTAQPLPAAEAPKWATCESLARDPYTRMIAGLFPEMVLQPTRLPRDPDYSKPPLVPPGSPLPTLGKVRFGADPSVLSQNAVTDATLSDTQGADPDMMMAEGIDNGADSVDQARIACRLAATRGPTGRVPSAGATARAMRRMAGGDMSELADLTQARMAITRTQIAARDTTLPMAFALFDQGRYAESFDWFRRAYHKLDDVSGGDEAALFIGKLYLDGLGDRSDTTQAIVWLKKAAMAPFNPRGQTPVFDPKQPRRNTAIGEAAVILGNIYARGYRGAPKDLFAARGWYERAYAVGHIPAATTVGAMYRDGHGAKADPRKAAMWFKRAARFGVAPAQVALADLLSTGAAGVKVDRAQALAWYREAAKSDHPDGLYALAHAYDFGLGVKADPATALGFYKTAALKGSAEAKTALGTYFRDGRLVTRDPTLARKWFASAAISADPDGMYNLAAMLANGQGGRRDLPAAWVLLKQASARGNVQASTALAAVEQRMSPTERQSAEGAMTRR